MTFLNEELKCTRFSIITANTENIPICKTALAMNFFLQQITYNLTSNVKKGRLPHKW